MCLYNMSINLKGLRYMSESPGFIPLLWWLLSGEDPPRVPVSRWELKAQGGADLGPHASSPMQPRRSRTARPAPVQTVE